MKILGLLGKTTDEGLSGLGRLWDELTGGAPEVQPMRAQSDQGQFYLDKLIKDSMQADLPMEAYQQGYTPSLFRHVGKPGLTEYDLNAAKANAGGSPGGMYTSAANKAGGAESRMYLDSAAARGIPAEVTPIVSRAKNVFVAGVDPVTPELRNEFIKAAQNHLRTDYFQAPAHRREYMDGKIRMFDYTGDASGLLDIPREAQRQMYTNAGYDALVRNRDEMVFLRPEMQRRPDAQFDPNYTEFNNLFASRPEAAVGAAALGGGLLGGSEEAEAAPIPPPISRLIQLGLLGPEYAANATQVARATTRYNKAMKESRAFRDREMQARENEYRSIFEQADLPEQRIIRPEDLQGKPLIPVKGDQSDIGVLSQVGGVPVERVTVQGGRKFPKQYQEEGFGWASNIGPAEAHLAKARNIAEITGEQPISIYTAMGPEATNFSTPIAESMLKQAQNSPLAKKDIAEFDRELRNLKDPKTKEKMFPDWVGLESPDAMAQLMGTGEFKNVGKRRTAFSALMGKAKYRERGFPSYDETLRATQDPALAGADIGHSGMSSFAPNVEKGLLADPTVHRSYSHVIPGQYQGSLGQSVPFEVMFQDPYAQISGRVAGMPQRINTVAAGKDLYQMADQEWVDRVSEYLRRNPVKAAAPVATGSGSVMASVPDLPPEAPITASQFMNEMGGFGPASAALTRKQPMTVGEAKALPDGLLGWLGGVARDLQKNTPSGYGKPLENIASALEQGSIPNKEDILFNLLQMLDLPETVPGAYGVLSERAINALR